MNSSARDGLASHGERGDQMFTTGIGQPAKQIFCTSRGHNFSRWVSRLVISGGLGRETNRQSAPNKLMKSKAM